VGPDWVPPEKTNVTIQVFDNKTKNYVSNAFVKMGSLEGYTNETGFITFSEVPTFSTHTLDISKSRYYTLTKSISVTEKDPNLAVYLEPTSPGKFEIKAITGLTEVVSTVEISDSLGVVTTVVTPNTLEVNPGTYTLKATYKDQTQVRSTTVLEGQTVSVIFEFEEESEFNLIVFLFIVAIAIAGAALIWKRFRD
jgi:hypothetical protein